MESKGTRLEKRGGIWYILWPGNSRGRSTKTADRPTAERALAEFILSGGADAMAGSPLTVANALDHYWNEHGSTVASADQVKIASGYLRIALGHKRIFDLHDNDFTEYDRKRRTGELRLTDDSPVRRVGDSTIRREFGILSTAFHHETRKRDPITRQPRLLRSEIPTIKLPPKPPARDLWARPAQEAQWFAACPVEMPPDRRGVRRLTRVYRFAMIATRTAARREAIETLTWAQVDFGASYIDFNPPGRRQTGKRRPKVRMSDDLIAMMLRAADEAESLFVLDHPGEIRHAHETVSKRAKLEWVTPHVWRHTWATRAARAGVSMREIADVLGDDVETVERNYMHHHPDFQKGAVNWRDREGDL
jgi:integrase